DEVDTVGGLVVAEMGRLLAIGEEVEVGGLIMRVDEMERNSVVLVSFPATDDQQARLQEALS
nr:hypothetical protein [Caldilineaceae bacterium]